jgi:hypothetical protein
MGLWGKGSMAACALAAICAIALSACGGGGDGKDQRATAGASGAAGATSGTTGTTAASGASGARGNTGGASVPSVKTTKPKRKRAPASPSVGGGIPNTVQSNPAKKKNKTDTKDGAVSPLKEPTKPQLKALRKQAKEVCKYLTLDGLAHEYNVPSTPDAVATAYAKSYPKKSRDAVYRGCKAGLT